MVGFQGQVGEISLLGRLEVGRGHVGDAWRQSVREICDTKSLSVVGDKLAELVGPLSVSSWPSGPSLRRAEAAGVEALESLFALRVPSDGGSAFRFRGIVRFVAVLKNAAELVGGQLAISLVKFGSKRDHQRICWLVCRGAELQSESAPADALLVVALLCRHTANQADRTRHTK